MNISKVCNAPPLFSQLNLPAKPKGPQLPAKINRQIQLDINKAIEEDPSVFEYDSVYDTMKEENAAPKEKKPRYMETLLKTAELRKQEDERRSEKKIQKEREAEGDEFADKDAFITSAYKEKLEELKAANLKEQREKQCEDILDVRKQNDLTGFYRHLLKQSVGEEKIKESARDFSEVKLNQSNIEEAASSTAFAKHNIRSRQLRTRRNSSSSESDEEAKAIHTVIEPQSSSKIEEEKPTTSVQKDQEPPEKSEHTVVEDESLKEPPKPKLSRIELIKLKFTKRTVGEVFENAQERYFERKKLRYG